MFKKYMSEYTDDSFIDLSEDMEEMKEEDAKDLFESIMTQRGTDAGNGGKIQVPEDLVRELKTKTNLSLRKIAAIVGLNKDKVNKILNEK